jgi:hypothetical protein
MAFSWQWQLSYSLMWRTLLDQDSNGWCRRHAEQTNRRPPWRQQEERAMKKTNRIKSSGFRFTERRAPRANGSRQSPDKARAAMERMELYCMAHPRSPTAVRRPRLFVRDAVWIALLGPSIEEGIAGFGNMVEAALRAFDAQYLRGLQPPENASNPSSRTQADCSALRPSDSRAMKQVKIDLAAPFDEIAARLRSIPSTDNFVDGQDNVASELSSDLAEVLRSLYEAARGRQVETQIGFISIAPPIAGFLKDTPFYVESQADFLLQALARLCAGSSLATSVLSRAVGRGAVAPKAGRQAHRSSHGQLRALSPVSR